MRNVNTLHLKPWSVLLYLIWFNSGLTEAFKKFPSQLFYEGTKYSVQNPNLTFAAFYDFSNPITAQQFQAVSAASAVLCAVETYNNGQGLIPVKGNFNLIIYDSSSYTSSRQYGIVRDGIGQNIFYRSNNSQLGPVPDVPIGTIFSDGSLDNAIINALSVSGFPIPTLFSFTNTLNALYFAVLSTSQLPYYDSTSILSHPSPADLFAGVRNILLAYNWTLVGLLFSADNVGFPAQETYYVLESQYTSDIRTPCIASIADPQQYSAYDYDIQSFSTCIKNADQIRVVVLVMSTAEAIYAIHNINTLTGLENQLVFIIQSAAFKPFVAQALPDMSIFFSASGSIYDRGSNFSCASSDAQLSKYLSSQNLNDVKIGPDYCYIDQNSLLCKSKLTTLDSCNCTDALVYSYSYDSVNTVMMAIYMMQNNCSLLDECVSERALSVTQKFCDLQEFDLQQLSYAIKCVNFTGLSGRISFFNQSIFRSALPLNIFQVQPSNQIATIGTFSGRNFSIDKSLVYFYNNETVVSEIVVDDPSISTSAISAVFFGIDIVLMIITITFALYIFINRKNRVIRKSSPTFCLLILLGLLCGELSIFFISFGLSDFYCRFTVWLLLIGVSLVIGGLLAKNYRIHRIFRNRTAQALVISDLDLIYFTGAILLITAILAILYMTVGGPLTVHVEQSSSNSLYFYSICLVENRAVQTAFVIVFFVYFIMLFMAAAILAFLTRKVDTAYNESSDMAFIICSWIALAIIYAPIYYIETNGSSSNATRYLIRYMAIEIAIAITLAVLFAPKIFAAMKYKPQRRD